MAFGTLTECDENQLIYEDIRGDFYGFFSKKYMGGYDSEVVDWFY